MELAIFRAPWSHIRLRLPKRSQPRDTSTPWSRLMALLGGREHHGITHDTLMTLVRLALIGYIPQRDVPATADAMFDDLIWRHREVHGPGGLTIGTLRAICQEAHEIEECAA